ncbi:MAG: glycosyltransferase [Actinobacteria bacterium]|nr:glycosyltransferase [Actinomycetota bacterium]
MTEFATESDDRAGLEAAPPGAAAVGHVIVAARDEADRIGETVTALSGVFGNATVVVCDDGSDDGTAAAAEAAGAVVVGAGRHQGKGQAASLGAARALADGPPDGASVVLLADADLARSAARLAPLAATVAADRADVAVASFARRVGGGFGLALGFAHWAIVRRSGLDTTAPISGQRALTYEALAAVTPFRDGFGMEIGMTVDAVRAGLRVEEVELDLAHRATGKSLAGFIHRGRQLRDFVRVYRATARPRAGGANSRASR